MIKKRGYKGLSTSLPIYVTRKTADGEIMTYSMSIWMSLLALMVAWANVVAWGIYGLFVLVTRAV